MATKHGSQGTLKLNDGSLRDVSGYVTDTGMNRLRGMADITTIGVITTGFKSYIPGLQDLTIPLSGNYDPTVDGYLNTLFSLLTAAVWEYQPAAGLTGDIKYSGTGFLTKYEIKSGRDDAARIDAEWQNSGVVTRTVL